MQYLVAVQCLQVLLVFLWVSSRHIWSHCSWPITPYELAILCVMTIKMLDNLRPSLPSRAPSRYRTLLSSQLLRPQLISACSLFPPRGWELSVAKTSIILVLSPPSSIALELIFSNSHIPFNLGTGMTSLLHFIAGLCFPMFSFCSPFFVAWPENSHLASLAQLHAERKKQFPSDVCILKNFRYQCM